MKIIQKVKNNLNLVVINQQPFFEIKTISMSENIFNFLVFDILLLSYKGDHVLCDTSPITIEVNYTINFKRKTKKE